MVIYGSNLCPDTTYAVNECKKAGFSFQYKEISGCLMYLKEFIALRDENSGELFTEQKSNGKLGIPCFVFADGFTTLDLTKALEHGPDPE